MSDPGSWRADDEIPGDETIRVRPAANAGVGAEDDLSDETVIVGRRSATDAAAGEPGAMDPGATELATLDDTTAGGPGPRRRRESSDPAEEPDDGSTMVVRRESRRRAAQGAAPAPASPAANEGGRTAPLGRLANEPRNARPAYGPRTDEPVRASRTAPAPRAPQAPVDSAAVEAAARRRARTRGIVAVIAAVVLLSGAAAVLIAILAGL